MRSLFSLYLPTNKQTNCHNENDKPYTVGPRITTNSAKNGQNGTRCSVARKWALAQRTDQWCKDKDDVNREEPFSLHFYPQTNKLTNCHNENDKPYTVGPRITTNSAKNGQNGTRCSVARKWALAQRTDQWCKDKDDVNREEPFSHYFYPSFNRPKEGEQIGESFFFFSLLYITDVLPFLGKIVY